MIALFHQTQARPTNEYTLTDLNNNPVGTASNADEFSASFHQDAYLHLQEGEYRLHITTQKSIGADGTKQRRYPIYRNGQEIGAIEHRDNIKKTGFLKREGYRYHAILIDKEQYEFYELGFGPNQHYFCIHKNGETVAVVHMADESTIKIEGLESSVLDDYTIYAEDNAAFVVACIVTMYFEAVQYNSRTARAQVLDTTKMHETEVKLTHVFAATNDVALSAKFDPDFIPRIQVRDGHTT